MNRKQLGEVIDTCIELSSKLQGVEIVVKGLHNKISEITTEIDEISTKLFFHYKDDGNDE